jgi:hypothetical protein
MNWARAAENWHYITLKTHNEQARVASIGFSITLKTHNELVTLTKVKQNIFML